MMTKSGLVKLFKRKPQDLSYPTLSFLSQETSGLSSYFINEKLDHRHCKASGFFSGVLFWREGHTSQSWPWALLFWRQSLTLELQLTWKDQAGLGHLPVSSSWVLELKASPAQRPTVKRLNAQLVYCAPLSPILARSYHLFFLHPSLLSFLPLFLWDRDLKNPPASTFKCWYYRSMPPYQLADFFFFWINVFGFLLKNNADAFITRQCQFTEYILGEESPLGILLAPWKSLLGNCQQYQLFLDYLKLMYSHSLLPRSVPHHLLQVWVQCS